MAITQGHARVLHLLLRHGGCGQAQVDAALCLAVQRGDLNLTQLLLQHGADSSASLPCPCQLGTDNPLYTAYMYAHAVNASVAVAMARGPPPLAGVASPPLPAALLLPPMPGSTPAVAKAVAGLPPPQPHPPLSPKLTSAFLNLANCHGATAAGALECPVSSSSSRSKAYYHLGATSCCPVLPFRAGSAYLFTYACNMGLVQVARLLLLHCVKDARAAQHVGRVIDQAYREASLRGLAVLDAISGDGAC